MKKVPKAMTKKLVKEVMEEYDENEDDAYSRIRFETGLGKDETVRIKIGREPMPFPVYQLACIVLLDEDPGKF